MLVNVPIDGTVDGAVSEYLPVSAQNITYYAKDAVFWNRTLRSYWRDSYIGRCFYTLDEKRVTWDSNTLYVDGNAKAALAADTSKPIKGRWVISTTYDTVITYPVNPNSVAQIPVHGHGTSVDISATNVASWAGYTWTITGIPPQYFFNGNTLYEIYQGKSTNRQMNSNTGVWSTNTVSYACIANNRLCLSYSTGTTVTSGTLLYNELNNLGTVFNSCTAAIAGMMYQRVSAPGIEMSIIQNGTSFRVVYINDAGTVVNMTPQSSGTSIKWRTLYWNLWRKDTRIFYVGNAQAGAITPLSFLPCTPVLDERFINTGTGWTLCDDDLIYHGLSPSDVESASQYLTRLSNVVIADDSIHPTRALNLNFISPNIMTFTTSGTDSNIVNIGFANNNALELNNDRTTGGIYALHVFNVIGTPNIAAFGPGNGGNQVGTGIGDFYAGLNAGNVSYRWSTRNGTSSYIDPLLHDLIYYNTQDPILPVPVNATFGAGRSNEIIAVWDDWSAICLTVDSRAMLAYTLSSVIYGYSTVFSLLGNTYVVDNKAIYAIVRSGASSIGAIQFVAALDGLQFIGVSSNEALFYSSVDRCLYSFNVSLQLHNILEMSAWGDIRASSYHQGLDAYLLLTETELLILRKGSLATTGVSGTSLSRTQQSIVVTDINSVTRLRLNDCNAPFYVKTNFFTPHNAVWSQFSKLNVRLQHTDTITPITFTVEVQAQSGVESVIAEVTPSYVEYGFYNAVIPVNMIGGSMRLAISCMTEVKISDIACVYEPVADAPNERRGGGKWS